MSFHLNKQGDVLPCNVTVGACWYSKNDHFATEQEARNEYEKRNPTFKTIRIARSKKPIVSPFNNEGLTQNVIEFRDELLRIHRSFENYNDYLRRGGTDRDRVAPEPLYYIKNMIDEEKVARAIKALRYEYVIEVYSDALKRYYINMKFNIEDIDCLFSDEQIKSYLRYGK